MLAFGTNNDFLELPERRNRRILFIDMNSFFASCEQADRPELRNRPVIVTPTEGSSALSASYEAKAFGIKTGTSAKEARFLCPSVIEVRAQPKRYMAYHHQLTDILESLTPHVTMRSVDEGSVRLCRNEDPWQLAQEIKEKIWQEMSPAINCSIGIAPNVFLAKLATEMQKPNGLTEITLENLEESLTKVGLRDFCGINYRMERRLNQLSIHTPWDFYRANPSFLQRSLGVIGWRWWLKMHGYETDELPSHRKSLSHSHVLPPLQRDPKQAYMTLHRLVAKVGRRLRKENLVARWIGVAIRYTDQTSFFNHSAINPCSDTLSLAEHASYFWQQANPQKPILKLAVWTHDLTLAGGQPDSLFPVEQRRTRLSNALDKINDSFGTDTIRFAINDTSGSRAPDRISFNALFDIEHE